MNDVNTVELEIKEAAERFGVSPRNLSYWCMRCVDAGREMPAPFLGARRVGMKKYLVTVGTSTAHPADTSR